MLSKERRCPSCGKKLEVVYSGREETTVYMCMNDRCGNYGKSFGRYQYRVNTGINSYVTLDNWM